MFLTVILFELIRNQYEQFLTDGFEFKISTVDLILVAIIALCVPVILY